MAAAIVAKKSIPSPATVFERFGESRLWARQRDYFKSAGIEAWRRGEVPHYATSTAGTADIYADSIVEYWNAAFAAGDIDVNEPLYVLELGAGCGRLTYLLLKALREKLALAPHLSFCYLASDLVEANIDFIAAHPYLAPAVTTGQLDTVLWDAEQGGDLFLRAQGLRLADTANPVVVIANYVFDGLRHDLFGFEYGEMFEGHVTVLDDAPGEDPHLEYEWHAIEQADWLPTPWQRQLARYAERLGKAALFFPSGALRCLDHISHLTRGRYLLLSADKGICDEQALRLDSLTDVVWHGSFSLPVNYHALSVCLAESGTRTWNNRHREDGLIYHVALRADETVHPAIYDAGFGRIVQKLDALNPDDHFMLKKTVEIAAPVLVPEQLLAMLRLGCYDYRLLRLAIDSVLEYVDGFIEESRRLWREAVERCWRNYFPLGENDPFCFNVGLLAMRIGHWRVAKECLRFCLGVYGDDADTLYYLAQCEASTGRSDDALALLDRAIALDTDNTAYRTLHQDLTDRLRAWSDSPWRDTTIAHDGELTLEPLDAMHAADLFYQYRDEQIGAMTRLPELDT
ncbi:MAG TPA: tetratricopeptide repeat protein, partial [Burkholderiales bacterium]|nr:tetratricopeptide repeat protein [Burkholderiales bacterium]